MTVCAAIKADPTPWYADHDSLCRLGAWLVDEEMYNAEELLRFFEKPWKWDKEWRQMEGIEAGTLGKCEQCDEITDQKTGDGQFVCQSCIEF